MSQSKKRSARRASSAPGKAAQRRAASASRSSRPVVKQPIAVVPAQRPLRARIDKALPPFSLQRYLAIWLLGMIPLVALMLVLARGVGTGSRAATPTQATASATAQSVPTRASTPTARPATAISTPTRAVPTGSPSVAASAFGPGKYMVIETNKGRIVARLYTDPAANVGKTVANFEQKARSGSFDGLIFHRVEDWMVQGGDPSGTGQGGNAMVAEYNQLPFKAGALGVAHRAEPTINNDSQFFIVKTDAQYLNGQYTNWGEVVEGMDVVSKLVANDRMIKVTIEDRQ